MGLYTTNDDTGFVHADADELARKLKYGDGILWQGDERLELQGPAGEGRVDEQLLAAVAATERDDLTALLVENLVGVAVETDLDDRFRCIAIAPFPDRSSPVGPSRRRSGVDCRSPRRAPASGWAPY